MACRRQRPSWGNAAHATRVTALIRMRKVTLLGVTFDRERGVIAFELERKRNLAKCFGALKYCTSCEPTQTTTLRVRKNFCP